MGDNPSLLARRLVIAMSINKLCGQTEIAELTVDQVCDDVGISRSSFYRTFDDKYSVALWIQQYALEAGIKQIGRTLRCKDGLTLSAEGLWSVRHLILSSHRSIGVATADDVGKRKHAEWMAETVRDYHGIDIDMQLKIQIEYTAYAMAHFVIKWLGEENQMTADEHADIMESCFPPRLHSILDNPVEPRQPQRFDMGTLIFSS